ncbi:hypothetical protein HDU76_002435, partial [Blyttiomyces sp. JEL0837]
GFESLPFSLTDTYPSELADGGYIGWTTLHTNEDQTVGPITHPNIRWEFNQDPFGWTSLHHATYLRGNFTVSKSGVYRVSFEHVVSFKIDERSFVGNMYGYEHATGSAVFLEEGVHVLYICAVMDVRLFGGYLPPKVTFSGKFVPVDMTPETKGVVVFYDQAIVPEVLEGQLVTPYFSITVMNCNITGQGIVDPPPPDGGSGSGAGQGQGDGLWKGKTRGDKNKKRVVDGDDGGEGGPAGDVKNNLEAGWVQIVDVRAKASDGSKVVADIPVLFSLKLAPGQMYPLPVEITFEKPKHSNETHNTPSSIILELDLISLDTLETFTVPAGEFEFIRREWGDVYKITFLDYDNVVHYAMAQPPKKACSTNGARTCPVVLSLHGSGVEVSTPFWTSAHNRQDYAWLLFPSGRTPWGFDWHGPSFKNIESALVTLSHLHGVPVEYAPNVAINDNKLIYTGHSNGGQGAWWLTCHQPDRALASIPASGYLKLQFYTPYYMRIGDAHADPVFRGIMEASIAENDIDMYAANMAGIPILARHGGNDDNVPPMNTRRIVRLVNEWNRNPVSVRVPDAFTISTLNPGSTGSKGGIKILQLEVPLATIRVHRLNENGTQWILNTTNVRRFGFMKDDRVKITSWGIDGMDFTEPPKVGPSYLRKEGEKEWKLANDLLWISEERYSSTYGPASQILNHPFVIVIPSEPTVVNVTVYRQAAQHLATSWYLYGRGGTQIIRDVDVRDGLAAKYNLIVLGGPRDNKFTKRREGEGGAIMVKFLESGGFQIGTKSYQSEGTGIVFLAPSPTRTLMGLFLAGVDELGFMRALWTVPFRTGLMVPDYMVVGDEYGDPATGWTAGDGSPFGGAGTKGGGGVFAAGYWNNNWEFDPRCGYTK